MNNKQSDFIVKHNFRGALFLGSTVAIALLIIVGLPKGFGLPYIREVPFILLLVPVICIGIYVTWANFCLRKIVITGNECVYVNMWGRKKNFNLDNLRITFKDSENVLFYDKQGNKICRIEAYMEKLEDFSDYVCLINKEAFLLEKSELEKAISNKYKAVTDYLQAFFSEKKNEIVLEYGLQLEEYEEVEVYVLTFRAKSEKGYLGDRFLRDGNWEYKFRLFAYDKEKQLLYCENDLEKYIGKLYEQLVRVLKGNKIVKQCDLALLNMQKEINI